MLDRWRLIDSATGDRVTGAGIISLSVLSAVLSAGWIKIEKWNCPDTSSLSKLYLSILRDHLRPPETI